MTHVANIRRLTAAVMVSVALLAVITPVNAMAFGGEYATVEHNIHVVQCQASFIKRTEPQRYKALMDDASEAETINNGKGYGEQVLSKDDNGDKRCPPFDHSIDQLDQKD